MSRRRFLSERLVEQQDLGIDGERTRKGHALLLAP
jgi:hypothetical protein